MISMLARAIAAAMTIAVLALANAPDARAADTTRDVVAAACACADGLGGCCHLEADPDVDGRPSAADNCPHESNTYQEDLDNDGVGDVCDVDEDGDGHKDWQDNCPRTSNPTQGDADVDGAGDACDPNFNPGGPPPPPQTPASPESGDDRDAPSLHVRLPSVERAAAVASGGVTVTVTCSEASTLSADLVLTGRDARRLGFGRGPAVVAKGSWYLAGAGTTFLVVEPTRAARRRLARLRSARATVETRAVDAAGNRQVVTHRIRLRK